LIKWGILGSGQIANAFVKGLKSLPDAKVVAVGSRSKERADAFAKQYDIPNAYGSYEELVENPEVEIIYVATQHQAHKKDALLCLKAGKAVICEKPFTVNAREAKELIKFAREQKLFLTEAMWTRYLPANVKVKELLTAGIIGDVKMVKVDAGFCGGWNPESRLFNPELAGGALLDIGVYAVSYASMVFNSAQPSKIVSIAHIGETGVDEEFSAILAHQNGAIATLTGFIRTTMPNDVWIIGTKGRLYIPHFWNASSVTLYVDGKVEELFELPYEFNGYNYEAAYAMRCLMEGRIESDIMPLDESLQIMKTMDTLRGQWDLKYPFE